MDNLDFALETQLVGASQYFSNCVDKIYATSLNGKIVSFKEIVTSGQKNSPYHGLYLSPWSLMSLQPSDELVYGRIKLPNETPTHSWVRFQFNNEWYVYTCTSHHVYPEKIYLDSYKPHDIIFQQTKQEILDQLLTEAHTYQIGDYMWQFKSKLTLEGALSDVLSGYQFTVFDAARVTICNQKVTNFIGYECHVHI